MSKIKGRYELKHYINYCDVLQLRARLPFVASLDRNCGTENGYRIRSLYFDNYNDKALKEKIEGVNEREKFRLRLYDNDTSFIRLEKKSKKNGICYKESAVIRAEEDSMIKIKSMTKKNLVKAKTVSRNGIELTVEVRLLDMSAKLLNELLTINGVNNACLVSYNGEYTA